MNPDCILIRYGEIALKGRETRFRFENRLVSNIQYAFSQRNLSCSVKKNWGRVYVFTDNIDEGLTILQRIFGVTSFSPVFRTSSSMNDMSHLAQEVFEQSVLQEKTFALRVRRTGSHSFSSQDVAVKVGSILDDRFDLSVDLTNPDFELFIEIRDNEAFVFTKYISGPGGMPFGTQGTVLSYIDNPQSLLASWFLLKRGVSIVFLIDSAEMEEKTTSFISDWFLRAPIFSVTASKNLYEQMNGIISSQNCLAVCVGDALVQGKEKVMDHIRKLSMQVSIPLLQPLIAFNEDDILSNGRRVGLFE